ncbi:hypothetical protein BKA70DRAFT_1253691 [Coprinopsis sp. MPI-PUGE-AT-0042]|nr:hypothetical protein BKA70DRAFT_1253691 [Coprinopsis sp. MPI-PUGE-AT-0042]
MILQQLTAKISTRLFPNKPILQTPTLPFEILFRIIDEEFAAAHTPQARAVLATKFGRTCRELSIHCRALLFAFVHLQLAFDRRNKPLTDLKQSRTGRFAELARRYPHSLDLVQHLSLDLRKNFDHQGLRRRLDKFVDDLTFQTYLRRKQWLYIMAASYPNLKALSLACPSVRLWSTQRETQEALIKMLSQMRSLESLALNIGGCAYAILRYCPPTVKYLSYVGHHAGGELPINPPTRDRPRLEGFTFAVDYELLPGEDWLSHMESMLELKTLKYAQLWSANGIMGFNTFGPLIQPASATLRCLHLLGPDSAYPPVDMSLPILDLGSFGALQLFEVGISVLVLERGLQWISGTAATIPKRRAADMNGTTLIICIQTPGYGGLYWSSAEQGHLFTLNMCLNLQAEGWPGRHHGTNIYAFSEYITDYGKRLEEPRLLPPLINDTILTGDPPMTYPILLKRFCTCSGIQERVSS